MRFIIGIAIGLLVFGIAGKVYHAVKAVQDIADHQVTCTSGLLAYANGGTASIDARVDAAVTGEAPADPCSN